MEGTVLIQPHKGRRVTMFIAYSRRGEAPSEPGKSGPPSQTMREQEPQSRVAGPLTYTMVGTQVTDFFWAQLQVVISKCDSRKAKQELMEEF